MHHVFIWFYAFYFQLLHVTICFLNKDWKSYKKIGKKEAEKIKKTNAKIDIS